MLDLFQPVAIVPANVRRVILADMDAPIGEEEKQRQRMAALRLAWAARSKDGKVRYGQTRDEKLARRRERDALKRQAAIGSPAHEALKAQKRANYAALTPEQKKAILAQKREWYARTKRMTTPQGRHYEANKDAIKERLRQRYATDPAYREAKKAAAKAQREARRA